MSQDRSSGGYSSQSLDSEKQSRESGSAQSQHFGSSESSWGAVVTVWVDMAVEAGVGAEVVATAEGEGSSKGIAWPQF